MAPILVLVGAIGLSIALQKLWPIGLYTVWAVASALWRERSSLGEYLGLYLKIRPRQVLIAVPLILLSFGIIIGFYELLPSSEPALSWLKTSWLNQVGEEGTNTIAIPFSYGLFAPIWGLMLVAALPFLALIEERIFRRGTRTRADIARRSLIFGLVHCIVGVPLFVGLFVLPISGTVYSLEYLRALRAQGALKLPPNAWREDDEAWEIEERAVRASALVHLTYNLLVLAVVLVAYLGGF